MKANLIDLSDLVTPAVLIMGGYGAPQSAEIYQPDRDSACVLRDLPALNLPWPGAWRVGHTQDGSLLCGGANQRSCWRWNAGTGAWDFVTELLTEFSGVENHISWTPADGSVTFLMGGYVGDRAEVIIQDNSVRASFSMQHRTS